METEHSTKYLLQKQNFGKLWKIMQKQIPDYLLPSSFAWFLYLVKKKFMVIFSVYQEEAI